MLPGPENEKEPRLQNFGAKKEPYVLTKKCHKYPDARGGHIFAGKSCYSSEGKLGCLRPDLDLIVG